VDRFSGHSVDSQTSLARKLSPSYKQPTDCPTCTTKGGRWTMLQARFEKAAFFFSG